MQAQQSNKSGNKCTQANAERKGERGRERGRANFKGSVLENAKTCRNSTNDVAAAAASKQSFKVAKVYPVAPPGDVHNKNAHLNVNDFNGRTRKNLEPVLFITLTLMLSKDSRSGEGKE